MNYLETPNAKEIQKLMKPPNFKPRGHGIFISEKRRYNAAECECKECTDRKKKRRNLGEKTPCLEERIHRGEIPQTRVLMETFSGVKSQDFIIRINEYIKESENRSMQFKNEKHKTTFEIAASTMNQHDKSKMCALYLLTADFHLWKSAKPYVKENEINLYQIKLKKGTPTAYTLFCCAKDLSLGTKHLTMSDLADGDIIPPKIFAVICNAMAIRRYGLGAIQYEIKERENAENND